MSLWRQKKQCPLVSRHVEVNKFSLLGVFLLFVCALATYPEVHAGEARYLVKNATSSLSSQISELKDELLENPDNVESRYVLGILDLQLGAAIAAEKEFRRAQQYGWSRQLILPLLGEALLPQRKYQQILDDITVDDAYPESINAQILGIRGQAELGLNRLFSAEKSLQAGVAADPDALAVLLGELGVYQEKKKVKAFETTMNHALKLYPENQQLLLWQGLWSLLHDRIREAESVFQRVIDHEPRDLSTRWERQARLWLVQVYIRLREFTKAEGHIGHLLNFDPDSSLSNYLGAIVAFETGAYDLTRNRLVKVLDRHPGFSSARLLLGITAYVQGGYEQAAYKISSYLVSNPQDDWAQKLLVRSYLQLNDFERAGVVLQRWAGRDQENAEVAELVALNALCSDKPDRAIHSLEAVISRDIRHQVLLVSAYLAAGETGRALEVVTSLNEKKTFYGEYGVILELLKRKKWLDALDALQQLPKKAAGMGWALSLAGSLNVMQGNKE